MSGALLNAGGVPPTGRTKWRSLILPLGLSLLFAGFHDPARGQDEEAPAEEAAAEAEADPTEATVPAADAPPAERSPLPSEPKTPEEMFDAVVLMLDLARPDLAKAYLTQFLKTDPDDELLLRLREQYGVATFLRLANIRELQPLSTDLLDRSNAVFVKFATDPERIAGLIADLGGTPEQRAVAQAELRGAGIVVVPALVKALHGTSDVDRREALMRVLIRIGRPAVAPLIAALEAPDPDFRASVIEVLGWSGAREVVPHLWHPAGTADEPAHVRLAAQVALARLLQVPQAQVRHLVTANLAMELKRAAVEHYRHQYPWKLDPDGLVAHWSWNPAEETVVLNRVTPEVASAAVGMKFAREALALAPARTELHVLYLKLALATEYDPAGSTLPQGPGTAHDLALSAGPDVVARVVRESLAEHQVPSAIVGLDVLSRIGSLRHLQSVGGERSAIVQALNHPDRRVQFAAATAVMQLDPGSRFAAADRVVAIFARALANTTVPRALVVDASTNRGTTLRAHLQDLGYEAFHVSTGRAAFRTVAEQLETDLVLLNANVSRWALTETLANFRADARTAGVPIVIYGPETLEPAMQGHLRRNALTAFIGEPSTAKDLGLLLEPIVTKLLPPPLTPEQRLDRARAAAYWFGHMAEGQRSKLFDLGSAEEALFAAIGDDTLAPDILVAIGAIPTLRSQQGLADLALDEDRELALRAAAAQQLAFHIQRHSLLIPDESIERLRDAWNTATDPDLHGALAAVIGTLDPNAELVGERLRAFRAVPAAPPPPAPEPAAAPEALDPEEPPNP